MFPISPLLSNPHIIWECYSLLGQSLSPLSEAKGFSSETWNCFSLMMKASRLCYTCHAKLLLPLLILRKSFLAFMRMGFWYSAIPSYIQFQCWSSKYHQKSVNKIKLSLCELSAIKDNTTVVGFQKQLRGKVGSEVFIALWGLSLSSLRWISQRR